MITKSDISDVKIIWGTEYGVKESPDDNYILAPGDTCCIFIKAGTFSEADIGDMIVRGYGQSIESARGFVRISLEHLGIKEGVFLNSDRNDEWHFVLFQGGVLFIYQFTKLFRGDNREVTVTAAKQMAIDFFPKTQGERDEVVKKDTDFFDTICRPVYEMMERECCSNRTLRNATAIAYKKGQRIIKKGGVFQ